MSYGAKIENHSESVSTSATATMENRSKTASDIGHPFLLFGPFSLGLFSLDPLPLGPFSVRTL